MAKGHTTLSSTVPPRYIRDGIELYIHVDDLCRNLKTVPGSSPEQVALALESWKASLVVPGSETKGGPATSGRRQKK